MNSRLAEMAERKGTLRLSPTIVGDAPPPLLVCRLLLRCRPLNNRSSAFLDLAGPILVSLPVRIYSI
jgi:hypothetical protein